MVKNDAQNQMRISSNNHINHLEYTLQMRFPGIPSSSTRIFLSIALQISELYQRIVTVVSLLQFKWIGNFF